MPEIYGGISFKPPHLPLEMKEVFSGIPGFFVFPGQTSVFEEDHTNNLEPGPSLAQIQLINFLSSGI